VAFVEWEAMVVVMLRLCTGPEGRNARTSGYPVTCTLYTIRLPEPDA
jgi:hypothetical protein